MIMALNLAVFLTGSAEAAEQMTAGPGVFYGFLAGFGWIFFAIFEFNALVATFRCNLESKL